MKRIVYHVTQKPDGSWQSKSRGADRASAIGNTKAEVVDAARAIASNQLKAQLIIHKSRANHSEIQTEHTYGDDPRKSKG